MNKLDAQIPSMIQSYKCIENLLGSIPPSTEMKEVRIQLPLISSTDFDNQHHYQCQNFEYTPYSLKPSTYPHSPRISRFSNAMLIGASRYLITQNNYFVHDEVKHFFDSELVQIKLDFAKKFGNDSLIVKSFLRQSAWIDRGINIMHEYSGNYFHFICETIPRILLANESSLDLTIPFLIEDNLHKNLYELLDLVNYKKRKIIKLTPRTIYKCSDLYQIPDLTTILDIYEVDDLRFQSTYDLQRIKTGVDVCKKSFQKINIFKNNSTKIFAARRGGQRSLINQDAISIELSKLGFNTIYTDELDLESQIRLFSKCEIVVGPTGGQMANIVWCNKHTKVFILASDHPAHQLFMWKIVGKISQCNIEIIQGKRVHNKSVVHDLHDDYLIDIDTLLISLKGLSINA